MEHATSRRSHGDRLMDLFAQEPFLSPKTLRKSGIPGFVIQRALQSGKIVRIGEAGATAAYHLAGAAQADEGDDQTLHALAEISRAHKWAVLWGPSALMLHDLHDMGARRLHAAAVPPGRNRTTSISGLTIVTWSNEAMFTVGVEPHSYRGQEIRVTDPARTVLDALRERGRNRAARRDVNGDRTKPGALVETESVYSALKLFVEREGGELAAEKLRSHAEKLGWAEELAPVLEPLSQLSSSFRSAEEDPYPFR